MTSAIQKTIPYKEFARETRGARSPPDHSGLWCFGRFGQPRALPWAELFDPFRVEETSTHLIPKIGQMKRGHLDSRDHRKETRSPPHYLRLDTLFLDRKSEGKRTEDEKGC